MQVRFGASVFGPNGKRLGEVDGLVVDAGTKRARMLLVDGGVLDRARHMVAPSAVVRSDSDGLHLDATAGQTEANPPVVAEEEVAFSQRIEPPTTFIPAAGVGGPIYADAPPPPGEYPDDQSFFDVAPIDPPPVEVVSDLGANEVILSKGTDVFSSDRHKLGEAVAFDLGDREVIERVTVSEGFIFKEQSSFTLADIEEFGTHEIHLRLPRAEAEAR